MSKEKKKKVLSSGKSFTTGSSKNLKESDPDEKVTLSKGVSRSISHGTSRKYTNEGETITESQTETFAESLISSEIKCPHCGETIVVFVSKKR